MINGISHEMLSSQLVMDLGWELSKSDSKTCIDAVTGTVKNWHWRLQSWVFEIQSLCAGRREWSFNWVRRVAIELLTA